MGAQLMGAALPETPAARSAARPVGLPHAGSQVHRRCSAPRAGLAARPPVSAGRFQHSPTIRGPVSVRCAAGQTAAAEPGQPADRPHWQALALRAAACATALALWCCLSAGRPGSLFCSASVAARPGYSTAGSSALAGLAAGCLHSLSGPDHLAALTPLTIGRSSVKAALLGALWGFGHCIGQLILGLCMLVLKDRFQSMIPILDKYSSLTIGLTLVLIGVMGLVESLTEAPEEVAAPQDPPPLANEAVQAVAGTPQLAGLPAPAAAAAQPAAAAGGGGGGGGFKARRFNAWTLATGVVYGLQPDALFVIVPALALPTKLAAAAYMCMFVAGTVAAMGSYTACIGATSRAMQSRGSWFKLEKLSAIASLVALLMGLSVVIGGHFHIPWLVH